MKLSLIHWEFMAVKRRSVTQLFKGSYTKWGKEARNMKEEVHEKKGEGGVRERNSKGKAGPEKVQLQRVSAFDVFLAVLHVARALNFCIQGLLCYMLWTLERTVTQKPNRTQFYILQSWDSSVSMVIRLQAR
jgi:hypothetical protein